MRFKRFPKVNAKLGGQLLLLAVLSWVALVTSVNAYLPLAEDWENHFLPDFQKLIANEVGLDSQWSGRKLQLTYTGKIELVLNHPRIVADRSLPTALAQLTDKGHPWWLMMDELHVAVSPIALLLGKGDGSIRDITLKRPVLHVAGAKGQEAFQGYLQYLVKKYKKPKPAEQDWMRRSVISLEDYTLVSPQWTLPQAVPNWRGPVRLSGKRLAVHMSRQQRWMAQGDLLVQGGQTNPLRNRPRWMTLGSLNITRLAINTPTLNILLAKAKENPRQAQPWLNAVQAIDLEFQNWGVRPLMNLLVPRSHLSRSLKLALKQQRPLANLTLKLEPVDWLTQAKDQRKFKAKLTTQARLNRTAGGQTPWPSLEWVADATLNAQADVVQEFTTELSNGSDRLKLAGSLRGLTQGNPTGSVVAKAESLSVDRWRWLADVLPSQAGQWLRVLQGQVSVHGVRLASHLPLALVNQEQADPGSTWRPDAGEITWRQWQGRLPGRQFGNREDLQLKAGEGKLSFEPNQWRLANLNAEIGQGTVSANLKGGYGRSDHLQGRVHIGQLPVAWLVAVSQTMSTLPQSTRQLLDKVSGSGRINADVIVAGSLDAPKPDGIVRFDAAQLLYRPTGEHLTRLDGYVHVTSKGAATDAGGLAVSVNGSPVQVAFRLPLNRRESGWLSARGRDISLPTLRRAAETWSALLGKPVDWAQVPAVQGQLSFDLNTLLVNGTAHPKGTLSLTNLATRLPGRGKVQDTPIEQGQFLFNLNDQLVELVRGRAHLGQFGTADLKGSYNLQTKRYDAQLQARQVQLAAVQPYLPASLTHAKQYALRQLDGTANLSASVDGLATAGAQPHFSQLEAEVPLIRAVVAGLPDAVTLTPINLHLDPASQRILIRQLRGSFGPVTFSGDGWVDGRLASAKPAYDLTVRIDNLPVSSLHDDKRFWLALMPNQGSGFDVDIYNTAGSLSALTHLTPAGASGTVQFNEAGIYVARTPMPIHHIAGTLNWKAAASNKMPIVSLAQPLTMRVGNGEFSVNSLTMTGKPDYRVALSGTGRLTEIELNNLIGNPWYYQPTEYPLQTSVAMDISGQWKPGRSRDNLLTLRTSSVVQVQEEAIATDLPTAPTNQVGPSPSQSTQVKPHRQLHRNRIPDQTPPPVEMIERPEGVHVPTEGLTMVAQGVDFPANDSVGKKPGTPAKQQPLDSDDAHRDEPVDNVPTRSLPIPDTSTPLPVKTGKVDPLPQLDPTLDPALARSLQRLMQQVQPGYHALLTLSAVAQLSPQQLIVPDGRLRLLGRHEPIRLTMALPFSPPVKIPATPPAPEPNPSGLTGRVWMEKPLHLPDLNPEVWNDSYKFDGGDVSLDVYLGNRPDGVYEAISAASPSPATGAPAVGGNEPAKTEIPPSAAKTNPGAVTSKPVDAGNNQPTVLALAQETKPDPILGVPVYGQIKVNDIAAPNLALDKLIATIDLYGTRGRLTVETLEAISTQLAFVARADKLMTYPWVLTQGQITGKNFYVDGFQQFMAGLNKRGLAPVTQGRPASRRWLAADPLKLPFEIRQAQAQFNEAVVNNIILSDVTSTVNLFGNGYMELEELRLTAAGGKATGRMFLYPQQNNLLSLTLDSQQVEANALAKVLLNAPNEIFGSLSGRIQFTTFGDTNQEMIQNANGMSSFQIANGRLPTIAKVETLLTAANIYRGGLLGLNINNFVRAVKAFDTNYFAFLYGDFQIANGVTYTSNLISDGENLDLLIKGGIRLDNGVGNLTVVGNMSQNVKGAFGRVGQLSLRNIVRYIPVLGYLPGKQNRGLLNYVPGVGFLPGVGGVARDVNTFSVRMEGPLEDPASIKDLQWLH